MRKRHVTWLFSIGWAAVLVCGCGKTETSSPGVGSPASTPDAKPKTQDTLVAKFHWLGKKHLASESNATNFMAIWNMPESAKLEAQTLDKLSTAPWRLLKTATPLSNAPVALLRPLLDDLVQEESYFEIRGATNQPEQMVFAVRIDATHAARWQTNLAAVLESITGKRVIPTPDEPQAFNLQLSTFNFQASRCGDWTLLGAAADTNTLLAEFRARILGAGTPFAARKTNYWLEVEADAGRLAELTALDGKLSGALNFPKISLTALGNGQDVRTHGDLDFPRPLPVNLDVWNIPTNLIRDPLIGFSALRGIQTWAKYLKPWRDLPVDTLPNQIFFWAQAGSAPLHFFALPSAQASNQVYLLSEFMLHEVNPLIAVNPQAKISYGAFERETNSLRLRWRGMPYVSPNLDLVDAGDNPFIVGGLFSNRITNRAPPEALLQQVQTVTNLLYYDWEITEPVEYSWIQPSQVGRFVFGRARLSMTNNASLPWLVAIAPKLGNAVTVARLDHTTRISIVRNSTMGFTGAELHLFADWLESPLFPKGFLTLDEVPVTPVLNSSPKPTSPP